MHCINNPRRRELKLSEQSVAAMKNRLARLLANGKNSEGQGVCRKLRRKIWKAEQSSK